MFGNILGIFGGRQPSPTPPAVPPPAPTATPPAAAEPDPGSAAAPAGPPAGTPSDTPATIHDFSTPSAPAAPSAATGGSASVPSSGEPAPPPVHAPGTWPTFAAVDVWRDDENRARAYALAAQRSQRLEALIDDIGSSPVTPGLFAPESAEPGSRTIEQPAA